MVDNLVDAIEDTTIGIMMVGLGAMVGYGSFLVFTEKPIQTHYPEIHYTFPLFDYGLGLFGVVSTLALVTTGSMVLKDSFDYLTKRDNYRIKDK